MKYEEFEELIKCFKIAFNKNYDELESKFMYRYFKNYSAKTLTKVIDKVVKSYDKMPSLKQILDLCEEEKTSQKLQEEYKKLPPITEEDKREFQEILDSFS